MVRPFIGVLPATNPESGESDVKHTNPFSYVLPSTDFPVETSHALISGSAN